MSIISPTLAVASAVAISPGAFAVAGRCPFQWPAWCAVSCSAACSSQNHCCPIRAQVEIKPDEDLGHEKKTLLRLPTRETMAPKRHSPETSRQHFYHFGPAQHSLRLLLETSLGKALPVVGSAGAGLVRLPIPKRKDQPTTHLGSAPGRAAGPLGLRSTR